MKISNYHNAVFKKAENEKLNVFNNGRAAGAVRINN